MELQVFHPQVVHNLAFFQEKASSMGGFPLKPLFLDLDSQTGEAHPSEQTTEWRLEIQTQAPLFSLEKESLKALSDHSGKVIQDTLRALNLQGRGGEGKVLVENLSDVSLPFENIPQLPGWKGEISREQAEKLLKHTQVGTYLFRKVDPLALDCTFHLAETNPSLKESYLMSIAQEEQSVKDLLLLWVEGGWVVYEDDPILSGEEYVCKPHLGSLLFYLSKLAKRPLLS